MKSLGWILALLLIPLVSTLAALHSEPKPAVEQEKYFETQVQPLLKAHCLACHGGEKKIKGGLDLTSREKLLKGGDTGPAINLEKANDSLLLQALRHEDLKMPPKGKLSQAQIDVFTKWVEMGLPYPAGSAKTVHHGPPPVDEKARQFWAFRPVTRPEVPRVKDTAWVNNPLDAFVLAKLEEKGFHPAAPASKLSLLRRVHYAVTGLPPTTAEVDVFLADPSPNAYEKVVDRLRASPHYGEHWGRHWLDLVRYAETNSFERDGAKPFAWRYRDYVIRSFNQDKPYDQFIREQLAGDELDTVTPDGITATGYYRLGTWDDEPADPTLAYYDELDDIVGVTGQTFLGLTVNCARCHDHKIDPFPQKDYYSLLAFFHGIRRYGNGLDSQRSIASEEEQRQQKEKIAEHRRKLAQVNLQITQLEKEIEPLLVGGEKDDFKHASNRARLVAKHGAPKVKDGYLKLLESRKELDRSMPQALANALCVTEDGPKARDTYVFGRGNPQNKGDRVEPAFPSVLLAADAKPPEIPPAAENARTSGRRRVLADWIASPRNPMTARVMVNRIFQFHFGRGLVRSSSNFGYMGTPPTHPELLDYLATEFVNNGWKLKPFHRMILTSNAFRMSSQADPTLASKDPENDLLGHFDLRRLTAEEIRDSILAVCGNLNLKKTDGPSVYPIIPPEVQAGQSVPGSGWSKSTPEEAAARSVYVHIKRSLAVPLLAAFDAPDPDAPCPIRFSTTQPTQALGMLNGTFSNEQARLFAESLRKQAGKDEKAQIQLALRRVFQRAPTETEIERGQRFLADLRAKDALSADEALRRFCLLALNLNEFVHLD
jgi:mono/diheme cytochrome c family protein